MLDELREQAAKSALNDIRWLLSGTEKEIEASSSESYLDAPKIIELLEKNFQRLDPNDDGISREELMSALVNPSDFTVDEYEMLRLVTKYFDTIINMFDDEDGEELRISRMDMAVLKEFLVGGQMTLEELSHWCNTVEFEVGPPPLSDQ